jgi:hypothetical protein
MIPTTTPARRRAARASSPAGKCKAPRFFSLSSTPLLFPFSFSAEQTTARGCFYASARGATPGEVALSVRRRGLFSVFFFGARFRSLVTACFLRGGGVVASLEGLHTPQQHDGQKSNDEPNLRKDFFFYPTLKVAAHLTLHCRSRRALSRRVHRVRVRPRRGAPRRRAADPGDHQGQHRAAHAHRRQLRQGNSTSTLRPRREDRRRRPPRSVAPRSAAPAGAEGRRLST